MSSAHQPMRKANNSGATLGYLPGYYAKASRRQGASCVMSELNVTVVKRKMCQNRRDGYDATWWSAWRRYQP